MKQKLHAEDYKYIIIAVFSAAIGLSVALENYFALITSIIAFFEYIVILRLIRR